MRILDVLLTTRSVIDEYVKNNSTDEPIKILGSNELKEITAKQTGQNHINVASLNYPASMVSARLDRYKMYSDIWYSSTHNACWSRFYIAKELTHVLCGDESNYTSQPEPLIDALVNGTILTSEKEDHLLEEQAYWGAMELLIPSHCYDRLYQYENDGMSHRDIAEKFKVPEKIITFRLSSGVRGVFDQFKSEVN